MEKKHYEEPEMEVVLFDTIDIATDSIGDNDDNEGGERDDS